VGDEDRDDDANRKTRSRRFI